MERQSKLFLVLFAIFITTGLVIQRVDNCDEIIEDVQEATKQLDTLLIEQIELYKTYPGKKSNLVLGYTYYHRDLRNNCVV
jgi:hypothetical protein